MRHAVITTTLALAAAVGSAGLYAQPAIAAGSSNQQPYQVAQNNQGPNLFSLFQQIQQLQQQVRNLQGQVDTLQYQLKQNEQGQRDLYQNLDSRISKVETGGGAAAGANAAAGDAGNDDGSNADVPPEVQSAYMAAFDKLKNGQYDAAVAGFKSFVAQNPETSLTDNAWYWMGEAYYVQQDLGNSQNAFEIVVNRFASSAKVPASLYKIALIQTAQNQTTNAKATLERIVSQYPDSDSAGLAQQKLQSLGG